MDNKLMILSSIDNKTMLLILMIVLIAFIVLLVSLAIVFIIALRKRAPVIKVVMAPLAATEDDDDEEETEEAAPVAEEPAPVSEEAAPVAPPAPAIEPEDDDDEDGDDTVYVTEGQERVRYDRSFTAKICQLKNETKGWYTEIKNELMSYERVRERMSWRRESFRIGRMTFARLIVRGKTLCLLLAVEPAGYAGTKYTVEDVSNVASTADTPCLYRIKSARKLKYAKEMIAGLMKELKIYKDSHYEAQDFFLPYEGDMGLMERGLVKRVVTGSTRVFKIEEVTEEDEEAAITADTETDTSVTDTAETKASDEE